MTVNAIIETSRNPMPQRIWIITDWGPDRLPVTPFITISEVQVSYCSCFILRIADAKKVTLYVPPKMTPIAVNPIVLDVAGDEIVYPDLQERAAVKKTSTLRNLFSFGKR